jgi:anti-sigma factor RsiW
MHHEDRLIQRLIDGALSPHEAAALERTVQERPDLAARLGALRALHGDLGVAARPMSADQHHELHLRIAQRLPLTRPQSYARIRPIDLMTAAAVLAAVVMGYVLGGSLVHGGLVSLAAACISFVGGMLVLILAGMLRRIEAGLLARLLGHPVNVGPADLLVTRAVGIGLAIGGILLARL